MRKDYYKRLKDIFFHGKVIWILSWRILKMKYAGSRLGIWWTIISPLILALSISFIFTKVFKVHVYNYTFFVLSTILPWLFFSQSLLDAANAFFVESSLLRQINLIKEILPLSSVLCNFLSFLISFGVIIGIFLFFNWKVIFFLPMLVILLIFLLVFVWGLSFVVSTLNVFSKDVLHFLSIGLMIWFWMTPVFYSPDMIPYPYRIICMLNPLSYFVSGFRDVLYYNEIGALNFLISFILSIGSFLFGYYIFLCKEKILLKRL